jgi:hypothetical protein
MLRELSWSFDGLLLSKGRNADAIGGDRDIDEFAAEPLRIDIPGSY